MTVFDDVCIQSSADCDRSQLIISRTHEFTGCHQPLKTAVFKTDEICQPKGNFSMRPFVLFMLFSGFEEQNDSCDRTRSCSGMT